MAKFFTLMCVLIFIIYQVKSQIIRSPLSLLNRPFTETIIEAPRNYIEAPITYADTARNYIDAPRAYTDVSRNYFEIPIDAARNFVNVPRLLDAPRNYLQPNVIAEPPCNGILPITNIPNVPSTTIITDCTPSVCKNLVNTINLMIACNLMQNSKGSEQDTLRFAAPLLKDLLANANIPGYSNRIAPNGYSPYFLPQNLVAPNLPAPIYSPAPVAPRLVAPNSIAPSSLSPNGPMDSGLLSNLIRLLGGAA